MRKDRITALSSSAPFPPLLLLAVVSLLPAASLAQEAAPPPPAAAPERPPTPPAEPPSDAPPDGVPTQPQEEEPTDDVADASSEADSSAEVQSEQSPPETPAAELPPVDTEQPLPLPPQASSPDATSEALAPDGSGSAQSADFGAYPNPAEEKLDLQQQGDRRPSEIEPDRVFAEEWWVHTRPALELHGNFRVRANLYHNFHLNRIDAPGSALWPRPLDDYYTDINGEPRGSRTCTPDEVDKSGSDSPDRATVGCFSPTQGGADMRFRIEPTIVISDNLRVRTQIDLLGNLVMGSTAQGYSNFPDENGYGVSRRSGYAPVTGMSDSQASPVSGVNSFQDAVSVRRAWAEYETPFGELKFGRMPDHWGLGMLYNAGDDLDGDYQSTADRIAFTTGLPSWSVYLGGAWDFQDEGATSAGFTPPGGQPYDLSQRDDVSRMNLTLYRRMDPQLEGLALRKGKVVVNGGVYVSYRWQRLANDYSGNDARCGSGANALGCEPGEAAAGLVRRGMKVWTPDVYAELKYKKFAAAVEVVTHQGTFESLETLPDSNDYGDVGGWKVRQWGFAGQIEQKLVEDRLKLGFYFGWASGDGDVEGLVPSAQVSDQIGDNKLETFRFHPGYRVDLILNRHILSRVQGSYYVKPMAQYDFIRKASGMKVGGRAEAIWTRASQFMQAPGHQRDLGIELDATVYFQSQDGALNKREDLTGGFFGMMQYGIAFPLGGLGYQQNQTPDSLGTDNLKLKPAQMVRGFLGVAF